MVGSPGVVGGGDVGDPGVAGGAAVAGGAVGGLGPFWPSDVSPIDGGGGLGVSGVFIPGAASVAATVGAAGAERQYGKLLMRCLRSSRHSSSWKVTTLVTWQPARTARKSKAHFIAAYFSSSAGKARSYPPPSAPAPGTDPG